MFTIADKTFTSRLLLGTGKFVSPTLMLAAIQASGCEMVTLAMRRISLDGATDRLLTPLKTAGVALLPNTSGAKTAEEAVFAARLAREATQTNWIKLEIHPDPRYLMPDPVETLRAAEKLVAEGFVVLPYCSADPVLCKRLEAVGCAAVMPLGSPIGTNQGLQTQAMLRIIVEQALVPVIIDAGIGRPSHAMQALELGADAVLINTAIATADDPAIMANAFRLACRAGEYYRELQPEKNMQQANASSPLTHFLHTNGESDAN